MIARVLIVSAVIGSTWPYERSLARAGFDVLVATNGRDGLALCRRGRADVVIIEGGRSGLDAVALCRMLKDDKSLRHLPVGLLTPDGEPRQRLLALDAGVDECFSLPMADSLFLRRVRSLADLSDKVSGLRRATATGGFALPPFEAERARILVVDPDACSRERLGEILSARFDVVIPARVEEALPRLATESFAVAICDFDGITGQGPIASLLLQHLRLAGHAGSTRLIGLGCPPERNLRFSPQDALDDILLRPLDRSEVFARTGMAARKQALGMALRTREARRRDTAPGPDRRAA